MSPFRGTVWDTAKDRRSKLHSKSNHAYSWGTQAVGYTRQESGEESRHTTEDWKQQKSGSSSQSTPTPMDSGLVNSTQSTNRRQQIDTAESELVDSEQPTNTHE